MVIQLHENQHGHVRLNSDISESFPIKNVVKLCYVLVPTVFSILFGILLNQATAAFEADDVVYNRYRVDGIF